MTTTAKAISYRACCDESKETDAQYDAFETVMDRLFISKGQPQPIRFTPAEVFLQTILPKVVEEHRVLAVADFVSRCLSAHMDYLGSLTKTFEFKSAVGALVRARTDASFNRIYTHAYEQFKTLVSCSDRLYVYYIREVLTAVKEDAKLNYAAVKGAVHSNALYGTEEESLSKSIKDHSQQMQKEELKDFDYSLDCSLIKATNNILTED